MRCDEEKQNDNLKNILNEKQNRVRQINQDLENITITHNQICNERNINQMENDKLKELIFSLTEQNQRLNCEIEQVLKEDQKMRGILDREERMCNLLRINDSTVDSTWANVKDEIEIRSTSPHSPHSHHSIHCSPHCSPHFSPNRMTYNIDK